MSWALLRAILCLMGSLQITHGNNGKKHITTYIDASLKCPSGYTYSEKTLACYKVVNTPASWLEAAQDCQSTGSSLIGQQTKKERNWLDNYAGLNKDMDYWTAGHKRSGDFLYIKGECLSEFVRDWSNGLPEDGECVVAVTNDDHRAEARSCNEPNVYICKYIGDQTGACAHGPGHEGFELKDIRYILEDYTKNWTEAERICREIHNGANLASSMNSKKVRNYFEKHMFPTLMQSIDATHTLWVGQRVRDRGGVREYRDIMTGNAISEGLDKAYTKNYRGGDCIAFELSMDSKNKVTVEFAEHDCKKEFHFICEQSTVQDPFIKSIRDKKADELNKRAENAKNLPVYEIIKGNKDDQKYTAKQQYFKEKGITPVRRGKKDSLASRKKRSAMTWQEDEWENAEIHYMIDPTNFRPETVQLIREAIADMDAKSYINFIEITFIPESERYYDPARPFFIMIGNFNDFSWSFIGNVWYYLEPGTPMYEHNYQELGLSDTIWQKGSVQHELMHAIGIFHEHQRRDRDQYLDIQMENVIQGKEHNFEMIEASWIQNFNHEYDFGSIMHYPQNAFSVDWNATITLKSLINSDIDLGNREGMSANDYSLINTMYEHRAMDRAIRDNTPFQKIPIDSQWNFWGGWGSCSETCGPNGKTIRQRICNLPVGNGLGRQDCIGSNTEQKSCNTGISCPVDIVYTAVGCWRDAETTVGSSMEYAEDDDLTALQTSPIDRENPVEDCAKAAAEVGAQFFALKFGIYCYYDLQPYDHMEFGPANCETAEIGEFVQVYQLGPEPVAAQWSEWGPYDICSATCGNDGTKARHRTCSNPSKQDGGPDCVVENGLAETDITPCGIIPCPVDGEWDIWTEWSGCSSSCGVGTQTRSRTCTAPEPTHGGNPCVGNDGYPTIDPETETQECEERKCPVDGGWSEWINGTCDANCGVGKLPRSRLCNNPQPQYGGSDCFGESYDSIPCDTGINCPIDGGWDEWSVWGGCSASCGSGSQTRSRSCTNPSPEFGGNDCVSLAGELSLFETEQSDCEVKRCPVDGAWGSWTEGGCSVTCGVGESTRTRLCDNPQPQYGGANCFGSSKEFVECDEGILCPIDGYWEEWGEYSECSTTCGEGSKTRSRVCVPALYGGINNCIGESSETLSCEIIQCPIDGGFGDWENVGGCSVTCGGGMQNQTRACDNPTPQFDGMDCEGDRTQLIACNEQLCPPRVVDPLMLEATFACNMESTAENGFLCSNEPLQQGDFQMGEVSSIPGRDGNAAYFNGAERTNLEVCETATPCLNQPEECIEGLTMSFWIKPEQQNQNDVPTYIFSSGAEMERATTQFGGQGISIVMWEDGEVKVKVRTSTRQFVVSMPSGILRKDGWKHIAFTWHSMGKLVLYHNGNPVSWDQTGMEKDYVPSYNCFTFGKAPHCPLHYYTGGLDEVYFWERVLNTEEIYRTFTTVPTSCSDCSQFATCIDSKCSCLQGFAGDGFKCSKDGSPIDDIAHVEIPEPIQFWPMDTVQDKAIVDGYAFVDGSVMTVGNGVQGKAIEFDGRQDFLNAGEISCLGNPNGCNGFTIAFSMKFWGRGNRRNYVLSTGAEDGHTGISFFVNAEEFSNYVEGIFIVRLEDSMYRMPLTVPVNTWDHFAFTYSADTSSLIFFRNDEIAGVVNKTPSGSESGGSPGLVIGKSNSVSLNDFNGWFMMDNLAIFDVPLNKDQALSLYGYGITSNSNQLAARR
ncbi:unnamed protein product [Owenia fusiformis]|uniref:Metalloendopeptidase n=1 Tax=Owenia fusiformis TaxID=6347 RepID=A0A8S4N0A1_OWEFU|nr:unnamed protein product [Owenia fusiformis]